MFNLITPVELRVTASDTWATVDRTTGETPVRLLVDMLPSNTAGVFLHFYTSVTDEFGLRKPGSTDTIREDVGGGHHLWAMVGVDSSNNFEVWFGSAIAQEIWLVGYVTDDSAVFFTNAYDKTPAVMGSWEDVDLPTECPDAIGIIFKTQRSGGYAIGVRKNGSTDDRTMGVDSMWGIIGCDSGQVIECYDLEFAGVPTKLYILGYIKANATFNTNAEDISLTTTGVYKDMDLSAKANAILAFIEVHASVAARDFALRIDGSSEDMYYHRGHCWAIIGVPASGLIEGKIEATTTDFFLIGYGKLIYNIMGSIPYDLIL